MIFAGSKAPVGFQITVTSAVAEAGGVDLTLTTAATLTVKRPGGSVVTWVPTISDKTTSSLKLTYVFAANGGDIPLGGQHQVWPKLTIAGGEVPCRLTLLLVESGI